METREVPTQTLAEGERTGHAHRVTVKVMERLDLSGVREFDGATTVTHEEHRAIELVNKQWDSDKVKEYDYLDKEERKVID